MTRAARGFCMASYESDWKKNAYTGLYGGPRRAGNLVAMNNAAMKKTRQMV